MRILVIRTIKKYVTMEIPNYILDTQWEIKTENVSNQHISKNYGLFVALMACKTNKKNTKINKKIDSMFSFYMKNNKKFIIDCFENKKTIKPRIRSNVRLSIMKYIALQPVNICLKLCKQFNIGLNNGLFIYSVIAKNLQLFQLFVKKGYPKQINKGNNQIYHMINDALNMNKVPQKDFQQFIKNIIKAYPDAKISCYMFLKLVSDKQWNSADLMKNRIDYHMWTGQEFADMLKKIQKNSEEMKYLIKTGFISQICELIHPNLL